MIMDDATHEAVAIDVERAISGHGVVRVLDRLAHSRGLPKVIRTDNGKESPLKNPQTTSIARLHLRFRCAGIASFRYATSWFLAVFAHAYA
ncbi:hypothetical protein ADT26_11570, partial [Xanthomonas oryzae]